MSNDGGDDDIANEGAEADDAQKEETDTFTDDNKNPHDGGAGIQEVALVKCQTTAGPFTINLIKSWSPIGYERAVTLFERSFYDDSHFFRVSKLLLAIL